MATSVQQKPAEAQSTPSAVIGGSVGPEEVWSEITRASFATLSYVTPGGDPRSSGVVYVCDRHRLFVAVAPDSWKARHISANGRVSVVVPVHRFALLSLFAPIPPPTVSFRAKAIVHPAGRVDRSPAPAKLISLLPDRRKDSAVILELIPVGDFLVYGLGCSLAEYRNASPYHVPMGPEIVASR